MVSMINLVDTKTVQLFLKLYLERKQFMQDLENKVCKVKTVIYLSIDGHVVE